jgi:hypothetical protein
MPRKLTAESSRIPMAVRPARQARQAKGSLLELRTLPTAGRMLTPVNPSECARFARLLGIIPGALNGEKKRKL